MNKRTHHLSRRTVLKGAGVTMALPWLESLPVWGKPAEAAAPLRFATLFMANGINYPNWWAKGEGAGIELGPCLEPLQPIKEKTNFIFGLFNKASTGVGIHPGQTGNILSGADLQKGSVLKGGISMDQVLAARLGQETVQSSLVLGCEQPVTGWHETNFSMVYSSHISWRETTAPVPMEVYPSLAFDSLFDNRGSRRMESILDRVKDHASHLKRQISHDDQSKLDEYLSSVRDIEVRAQRLRDLKMKADERARDRGKPVITMPRPDNGMPEDIRQHMRLMCDIIALAFQTDKTRIATLLLCRDVSGLIYPFLNARASHHTTSHDDKGEEYQRITTYYSSQFAYLAQKLDSMPEGEGTVLDNSCLMFINNFWSGAQHESTRVPVLLAGGLGGSLQTGRVLNYEDKGDESRKLCSMYLSIMDRMGVQLNRFGDADARLVGI
jgi:hypothetical protein